MDLENLANWLNDRDDEWWPFLFMRPAPEERMSSLRVLGLAALYGAPAGALMDAWTALAGRAHLHPALVPLIATAALFVVFRLTLACAWNRRAARLAR